jgi:hypothetical protein
LGAPEHQAVLRQNYESFVPPVIWKLAHTVFRIAASLA